MNDLIKELIEKAGLSEEQAQNAFSTMVNYVRSKVPEGLSDKVEGLLSGNFDMSSFFDGGCEETGSSALDALKGMFGEAK